MATAGAVKPTEERKLPERCPRPDCGAPQSSLVLTEISDQPGWRCTECEWFSTFDAPKVGWWQDEESDSRSAGDSDPTTPGGTPGRVFSAEAARERAKVVQEAAAVRLSHEPSVLAVVTYFCNRTLQTGWIQSDPTIGRIATELGWTRDKAVHWLGVAERLGWLPRVPKHRWKPRYMARRREWSKQKLGKHPVLREIHVPSGGDPL